MLCSVASLQGQFCDHCNANDPDKAHPVTNAIDGTERWWQSPPLSRGLNYNEVNVTLDLGQLFHVAYVIVKFANSPRPDLWVLERSVDHGRTFMPWQYFAHSKRDCIERFGKQPNGRIHRDDDQICMTEYSRIVPLENGEIVVSLVNGRPGSKNFTYSPVLQDFTKATNIRLRFLRTNTLLGHLISKAQRDPTVTRRYYYSIKDISVGGRCVCHGHAQVCGARVPGRNQLLCECEHNTCGESCDRCCPGFHQKPWRPATANSPNECEPCQCHSHATDCYYDPEVERRKASLNIYGQYDGGGVCVNCQHNTAGVNCEVCAVGYYRPHGIPRESHTGCIPCRCDSRTTVGCEMGSGRCLCKPQYSGDNCERCARGYYGYPRCIPYPIPITTTQSPAGSIIQIVPWGISVHRDVENVVVSGGAPFQRFAVRLAVVYAVLRLQASGVTAVNLATTTSLTARNAGVMDQGWLTDPVAQMVSVAVFPTSQDCSVSNVPEDTTHIQPADHASVHVKAHVKRRVTKTQVNVSAGLE
ncbi:hypothetical protein MHYP_G00013900 [Metynnis hypsauchen]